MNYLETFPNAAPGLKPTPGRAPNPALGQDPPHTIRLQSPPSLTSHSSVHSQLHPVPAVAPLQSSISRSAPAGLEQESWEHSGRGASLWGRPRTCPFSHFSSYVSGWERASAQRCRKGAQIWSGKIIKTNFTGGFLSCKHRLIPVRLLVSGVSLSPLTVFSCAKNTCRI